jgi:tRNA threonylcarbamoyladenosine biosynthesis protein TsaE
VLRRRVLRTAIPSAVYLARLLAWQRDQAWENLCRVVRAFSSGEGFTAHGMMKVCMRPLSVQQWLTPSAEATRSLGVSLGLQARGGDFVACCGPLGAGKTTFIQGFAEGIGVGPEAYVRSPTFTLVHEYQGRFPLYHFDFYRLSQATEVEAIGFEEYCRPDAVVIVEWADKFPELLPKHRLDMYIEIVTCDQRSVHGMIYDNSYTRYFGLVA